MKPEHVSESDYERLMAKARASIEADPEVRFMAAVPQFVEVAASGNWLQEQVVAEGAADQEAQDLCFAHGQACFPRREPWATALAILQRWRDGRAPKPGASFGGELLSGDVSDLPKGGLRIQRR